ncbi:hypothetical protein [Streptomyces sp. NPDC002346]
MTDDEDQILADALGAAGASGGGAGGRRGAAFAAKRLKKNVHEIDVTLAVSLGIAVDHVTGVLARAGHLLEAEGARPTDAEQVIRAIVGGGFGNMNPVLITVGLTDGGPECTVASVRGVAKEGLIKQRAGEKTAKRIVALLGQQEQLG